MLTQVDHLVVLAASLEEGERWCQRTLGLRPGPGGQHVLMGTHNRLLRIDSAAYDQAYLEIIAIEPGAPTRRSAHQRRWFDLDDRQLAARIEREGPTLAHWVARTDSLAAACVAWQALGIDRGEVLAASRMTPQGLLQWQITVRDDGARLFEGCLPTLIEWGDRHPAPAMTDSRLRLQRLLITHPQADLLHRAAQAVGIQGVGFQTGPARIEALIHTTQGPVVLAGS
jgi:hypothetical protein